MIIIDKIDTLLFKFKYRKNIKNPSIVLGSKGIKIGQKTMIGQFSVLKAKRENIQGSIIIGNNVYIGENAYVLAGNGRVDIGNDVYAGNNLVLLGGGNISIANNVLMSHNIVISSSSHDLKDKKIMANKTPAIFKAISILDNVFIGANTSILMGVTIKEGAVIGAGSVVTENTVVNEYEVWAGNPAKRLYTRTSLKEQIEKKILDYLKTYPFHNLFFLDELREVKASHYGGICSDRSIHFQQILNQEFQYTSIDIKLHQAFINKQKTHTILRIKIDTQVYFCDVGMGFPISKLIPSDKNIEFTSYDIKFKSVVNPSEIIVYIDEGKGEKELMKILQEAQSQEEVEQEILELWENKEKLPFYNKLRYFFIHNDKYYQIKNEKYLIDSIE